MNKSMLIGAVLDAIGVTAGDAVAIYSLMDRGPDYAEVVAVQPIKGTIKTPRQVCRNMTVTRQRPIENQRQIVGTAISAVVGGLLGNQIGGDTGKKIATVAGAVGGGYAGNKMQEGMQERDTYTATEARCSTVHGSNGEVANYDVKYIPDGRAGQIRMERDPGSQIPVGKNGRLILNRGETLR